MIYDCTQILNELDLLEIRLNILDPHVDVFVICESPQTFSGKEKPLYFLENWVRFAKWMHKIKHIVAPRIVESDSFKIAAFQKDFIRNALKNCQPDDVIYYGDVDEIWTPQTEEGKLRQLCYSYYLNMRSSEDWQGTNRCLYKNLVNLNELRAKHDNILENGGWHFTNMGGVEQIKLKLDSYDHQEFNQEAVKDKLEERMKNGEDYVGRKYDWQGKPFKFWVDESQLPKYLIENKQKWIKLFQS
jgi:hypothetical protein